MTPKEGRPVFDHLPEIPMDMGHQLDQSTSRFRTIRDGLPELIKNAKDQYARLRIIDRTDRQIVVIADSVRRSIAVVDFAGAPAKDFSGWMTWSSRTANRRDMAPDIEGGHGNGGKAFMVRGSTMYSFIESCADGKRTRMGFENTDPNKRYLPGYGTENGKQIRDLAETNPRSRLSTLLKLVAVKEDVFPQAVLEAFARRKAYTFVLVAGVTDWDGRRRSSVEKQAAELPDLLRNHPQAALTIETSSLWVIVDGRLIIPEPLGIQYPDPLGALAELNPISVPDSLPDPRDGELVSTGPADTVKALTLRTSVQQLRITDQGKAINVIRVKNERTVVANWSVAELVPRAESAFILGELRVPILQGEFLQDSHRSELADTPLARALRAWVSAQVDELATQIHRLQASETRPQDRSAADTALKEFRKLMREYLQRDPITGAGDGDVEGGRRGVGEGNGDPPAPPPRPTGSRVDQIVLEQERDVIALVVGTTVPYIARCYETQASGEKYAVPGVLLEFHCDDSSIVNSDGHSLVAHRDGLAEIWFRDPATGVESNRVLVETVVCQGVDVVGPSEPLKQGQRVKLLVSFQTPEGRRDDFLIQAWVDETDLGRISRTGQFTAGMAQGTATVRVRFGSGTTDVGTTAVEIGNEIQERKGRGGDGGDVPHILLCGTPAPSMEEYPADQRSHPGGEHHPTIIEEPQFPHVVWINPTSKESHRVRQSRGGSRGIGRIGSTTFRQFLALKCFDILKRLKVRQEIGDREVPEREFTRELAQAEMQCAGFVDEAYVLAETLGTGDSVE